MSSIILNYFNKRIVNKCKQYYILRRNMYRNYGGDMSYNMK